MNGRTTTIPMLDVHMHAGHDRIDTARKHFDEVVESYDANTRRWAKYIDALDDRTLGLIRDRQMTSHLDVGCGTGRLMKRIRSMQLDCASYGIDISPRMIELCRQQGLDVAVQDFSTFDPGTPFDLVTMQFNVFGYLAAQQPAEDVLNKALRLLAPDGVFLFDVLNPFCITFGSVVHAVPLVLYRLVRGIASGGIVITEYVGRSKTPVAMAMLSGRRIKRMLHSSGCTFEQAWVPYSETASHRWLPLIFSAHRVLVVRNG